MTHPAEFVLAASIAWAALLLLVQLFGARGKGRADLSRKVGSPWKGLAYIFTVAMLPSHKETVRLHKLEFSIGIAMHIGAFAAIAKAFALLAFPGHQPLLPAFSVPLLSATALCGLFLFVRRMRNPNLRAMSTLDDYLSVLLTVYGIAVAALHELAVVRSGLACLLFVPLFFYLPLGKLRHALFFFLARADYGMRLGYRGVYPAPHPENRSGHVG